MVGENTNKNIPNGKMSEKGHIQGAPALFITIAFLSATVRRARTAVPVNGRLEHLAVARAETQVRTARWNA